MRRHSKHEERTITAHCNECGVVFEVDFIEAAQPTQVLFCSDHLHLWKNVGWWTLYTHQLQEAKKEAECVWKAAQEHLLGILPAGERHEIEGRAVKVKPFEYLKRDAIQWLQAFHPGAYEAFRQVRNGVYIDALPGRRSEPEAPAPF